MAAERLFESVPNFSEGRRDDLVHAIASAAEGPAHLLDVHADADHNRSVVSLAGSAQHLSAGLLAAVALAAERIDLGAHAGVHPRVGAADVVPIVPLGAATLDESRELAREIGQRIWDDLRIPVFFYGYGARTLADIRAGRATPDVGGPALHPTAGAVSVGARRELVAFNLVLEGVERGAARGLARALREATGGLRGVQALAFQLGDGRVQLSMNLFRPDETAPADVVAEVERRGVAVVSEELVGLCPAWAAARVAGGCLLEGRLAAAAARAAAARCRERGGEEHIALAGRLDREALDLTALEADQASLLSGAERAAALRRVLPAAGIVDAELDAMLASAASGLRRSLTQDTVSLHAARMAALEAGLSERSG
jgi:glutamate formiminotransferase / 5-formyltetrahydrofolate cyclo-ligase